MIRRVTAVALFAIAVSTLASAQFPFLVADLNQQPAPGVSVPGPYHVVGNRAFFYAATPRHGYELWRTDGTASGTAIVTDSGTDAFGPQLADLNGTVYFVPSDGNLWQTDGTAAGTQLVKRLPVAATNLTGDGHHLFFTMPGGELWVSDGTSSGTHALITTITGGVRASALLPGDGIVYFIGNPEQITATDLLWRSDGTAAGTIPIKSDAFSKGAGIDYAWSGKTFYLAISGLLLKVDATSNTAKTLLKQSLQTLSLPHRLTHAGGGIYFAGTASDGITFGLQRIDVVTDAITMVRPFNYELQSLVALGDRLIVLTSVYDGPWVTDGTPAGTQRLAEDIRSEWNTSDAIAVGGNVYFSGESNAIYPPPSFGLFRTDGTRQGTGPVALGVLPSTFARLGDTLLFTSDGEPWRSDGTAAGTSIIRQLAPLTQSSYPTRLTSAGSSLFFLAQSPEFQLDRVWRTDGFRTVPLTSDRSEATILGQCGRGILFTGCTTTENCGLFAADADGTTVVTRGDTHNGAACVGDTVVANTGYDVLLFNLVTGVADVLALDSTSDFISLGNRVFFTTYNPKGKALMMTDGTSAGTSLIVQTDETFGFDDGTPLDVVNGKLLYRYQGITAVPLAGGPPVSLTTRASMDVHINTGTQVIFGTNVDDQEQVWATDGTPAGTTVVGKLFFRAKFMAQTNGRVYILDDNGGIWMTSGATGDLKHVTDAARDANTIGAANGLVYFAKSSEETGEELWVSDGTAAGTHLAGDINAGPHSSNPDQFVATDRLLFFSAGDDFDGIELWALPLNGQPPPHRHAVR